MHLPFTEDPLRGVFSAMLSRYGPQNWWPAEDRFEVMVGAVLTQNAAWCNVERAIVNLRSEDLLDIDRLLALPERRLAELIRPAGYFNVKARRLLNLCRVVRDHGGERRLGELGTERLRRLLLGVNGVGPETADDILLYAFDRPVFVVDAYTRRVFGRLGMIAGDEPYEVLRAGFQQALGEDAGLYNEFHALLVQHAKITCRPTARCDDCCLSARCDHHTATSPAYRQRDPEEHIP